MKTLVLQIVSALLTLPAFATMDESFVANALLNPSVQKEVQEFNALVDGVKDVSVVRTYTDAQGDRVVVTLRGGQGCHRKACATEYTLTLTRVSVAGAPKAAVWTAQLN